MRKTFLTFLSLFVLVLTPVVASVANAQVAPDPENILYIDLKNGRVTIAMFPELAPKHVERIKTLTRKGFYDGIIWHRVIDGFMAQTGDPTGTGTGGSDYEDVPAEFSQYRYKRGTIGMARSKHPDSANSQFFICFDDSGCASLTGSYTVWGQVVGGMEYVDTIKRGQPPRRPDLIEKMSIAADTE